LRATRVLLVIMLTGLLLAGCAQEGRTSVRLSAGAKTSLSAGFRRHSGTRVQGLVLEQGETVSISYQLQVESGTLELSIVDPDENEIWQHCFAEDAEDAVAFTAQVDGCYLVRVSHEDASGSYELVCKNTGS